MVIRADFDFKPGSSSGKRRKQEARPLRCLVLAGLSEQAHVSKEFFCHRIEPGELDALLKRLAPSFEDPNAAAAGQSLSYALKSLEDFHPDALVASVASLTELAGAASGDTAGTAPGETATAPDKTPAPAHPATATATANESDDQSFERLLGRPRSEEPPSRAKQTVDALIRQALGPATAPQPGGDAAAARKTGQLLDERLRGILADSRFRSLERAWRSLHWLLTRIEDDEAELHAIDVDKAALAAHLAEYSGRLEQSPLHRLLVDEDAPWDLIVGDYSFGAEVDDLMLLAAIGALAARAQAPFLAHGDLALAGCGGDAAIAEPWTWSDGDDELGRIWAEFRRHPAARWIGLAAPRFVLRHPYGRRNDPAARESFEELTARPDRQRFLWGNPAFACALLMIQSRDADGVEWPDGPGGDVPDLPAPLFDDGTGDAIQPPLEYLLGERARVTAMQRGLTVFAGGNNTTRIATAAISPFASGSR